MWTVSIMVTSAAYLLPGTRTPPGPGTFTASTPFSPFSNIKLQVSPSLTLQRCLLELFFFRADWYTNTSSLVLLLLKKSHPFLTLNHFTVSKTFTVMSFLSLQAGAADVKPQGPLLPMVLLGWASAWMLTVVVMVTGVSWGSCGSLGRWGCYSGLPGVGSPFPLPAELYSILSYIFEGELSSPRDWFNFEKREKIWSHACWINRCHKTIFHQKYSLVLK